MVMCGSLVRAKGEIRESILSMGAFWKEAILFEREQTSLQFRERQGY